MSTLLDRKRLENLTKYINQIKNKDGVVFELGVYKGGSSLHIAKLLDGKEFHIFDSFCGMPDTTKYDNIHKAGDFSDTDLQTVTNLLEGYDVKIHAGFIPETFSEVDHIEKICFAHIDLDIYDAYKDSLEFIYPRMPSGGIMILDDYGAKSCLGAKKATDEFFKDKPEIITQLTSMQYVIEKQ